MRLILLDFLARKWWVLLGIAAFAAMGTAVGGLYVFTPWAFQALFIDGQRGWFRTVGGLPLSRRSQATAWWTISVPLAALTAALALPIGALIFQMTSEPQMIRLQGAKEFTMVLDPKHFSPWFAAAIGTWLGLGYAALYFLICIALPTRLGDTMLQKTVGSITTLMMPLGQMGPMFMSFILPRNPGMMAAWLWVLFALVPVLVVLSWYAAPMMVARRLQGIRGISIGTASAPATESSGGLTGLPLLLTRILMFAGFCAALTALPAAWFAWDGQNLDQQGLRLLISFLLPTSFCLCGLANVGNDLRVLRSLPLSTARLAIIRLIAPLATGLILAIALTMLSQQEINGFSPPLKFLTFFLSISGGYSLIISSQGLLSSWKFTIIVLLGGALVVAGLIDFQKAAPFILPAGAVALILSYLLSKRGLRRSETYRKERDLIGTALPQQR